MIGTHTKATSRERGKIYLGIEVVETVRLAKNINYGGHSTRYQVLLDIPRRSSRNGFRRNRHRKW